MSRSWLARVVASLLLVSACATSGSSSMGPRVTDIDAAAREAGLSRPMFLLRYFEQYGVWLEEPRVVGGADATPGADPWQVVIIDAFNARPRVLCGGSLIEPDLVLTAAHCFENGMRPREVHVVAQTTELTVSSRRISAVQVISHRRWMPSTDDNVQNDNDIALLRLAEELPQDLVIPLNGAALAHNTDVRLTGFGRTSTYGATAARLQFIDLHIVDNLLCNDRTDHRGAVEDTMLCAGYPGRETPGGMCKGDSGGPLTTQQGGRAVLVGIVSFGPRECGKRDVPGVYTRVSSFLDWIRVCRTGTGSDCVSVT